MNISSLITSFKTGTYTVTRRARGNTTRGRVETGTTTTFTIAASVSPTNPGDILRLPEGRRETDSRALFTTTELHNGGQNEAFEADRVAIDGESWEVSADDPWLDSVSGGTGYKYILTVIL